jgi:hypothetical protein
MHELTLMFLVGGLICLAIALFVGSGLLEVLIAGGLASILTAAAMHFGMLSTDINHALALDAGLSIILAVLLWKPIRATIKAPAEPTRSSDLIGVELDLGKEFNPENPLVEYSGIQWVVRSDAGELQPGQRVRIDRAEVGTFWVTPC